MAGGDWVRKFFGLAIALSSFCMGGAFAANSPSKRMTLQELSPLASADQIAARLLTPVTQDRIHKFREKASVGLREQVIMAGEEPFEIYVPEPDAAGRFGLLVFFWPADEIQVPAEWWKVFRDRNTIYVAARKSGNVENIYDRRVPLALHVYEHARRHYHLDPERVTSVAFLAVLGPRSASQWDIPTYSEARC